MTLAWAFRTVMVVTTAVIVYLQAQDTIAIDPTINVIMGAVLVAISAINPQNIADKVQGN